LPQLNNTSILFWIFVADCPVYALFFGLNVLLLLKEKPSPTLSLVSIVGNFKYGLWTIFVFYLIGGLGVYWLFIISHLLLMFETILFVRLFSFKLKHVLIAIGWFLFNDLLDYYFALHPYAPDKILSSVALFAVLCSIVLPILLAILFSMRVDSTKKFVGLNQNRQNGQNSAKQVKKSRWAKGI
jgi:uncharacterized membrane protein YpjA